jgi:hypothetical protein
MKSYSFHKIKIIFKLIKKSELLKQKLRIKQRQNFKKLKQEHPMLK